MTKEEFLAELTAAKPVLMRYALYFAGNKDEAEELLQEAIVHAYMAHSKFKQGTNFTNWMITIMKNEHLNSTEKKKKAISYTEYMAAVKNMENNTPEQQTVVHDLQKFIEKMPSELKDVVKLRIQGMSYDEISKKLNLPITTIKNRLFDARKIIKKELKK